MLKKIPIKILNDNKIEKKSLKIKELISIAKREFEITNSLFSRKKYIVA